MIVLHALTLSYSALLYSIKVISGDSLHRLSPLSFCMQSFNYIHRLISDIDKELGLTLWAIQQVPYQNRIVTGFCSCLCSANRATDKIAISNHCLSYVRFQVERYSHQISQNAQQASGHCLVYGRSQKISAYDCFNARSGKCLLNYHQNCTRTNTVALFNI